MSHRRRVILLTGFGPFPGTPENATGLLVPELAAAAQRHFPGYAVRADILPTEWAAAPLRIAALLAELSPALALHFGVSARAVGFAIEARGRNVARQVADACGAMPKGDRLTANGPAEMPASLPVAQIVRRLRQCGLPAYVSRDAGGYVCNALLYTSLGYARAAARPGRHGFVHIPAGLVRASGRWRTPVASCLLDWQGAIDGGLEIIAAALGAPPGPGRRRW